MRFWLWISGLSFATLLQANQTIYHSYWFPTYHGQRLDYCFLGDEVCGRKVADSYCQKMGYKHSDQIIRNYNVGLTHYINTNARCQGWTCQSFKIIRCVGEIPHLVPTSYMYRLKEFVLPRYNNYRIAWCNADGKDCGKIVATSFCKRMGYLHAHEYKKQDFVLATRTIKEQKLCFGPQCEGFSKIICYR